MERLISPSPGMRVILGFDLAGAAILPGAGRTPGDNAGGATPPGPFSSFDSEPDPANSEVPADQRPFRVAWSATPFAFAGGIDRAPRPASGRRLSRIAVSCGLGQSNGRIGVVTRWRTSRDSRLNLFEQGSVGDGLALGGVSRTVFAVGGSASDASAGGLDIATHIARPMPAAAEKPK